MSDLVSCDDCARHVRASEHACPFCGAEVRRRPPELRIARGATRAAIFYAGLALAGCDGGSAAIYGGPPEPETIMQPYGAPPDPDPPETPPETPPPPETTPETTPETNPSTVVPPESDPPTVVAPETNPPAIAAPYGAPPMPPRRRRPDTTPPGSPGVVQAYGAPAAPSPLDGLEQPDPE